MASAANHENTLENPLPTDMAAVASANETTAEATGTRILISLERAEPYNLTPGGMVCIDRDLSLLISEHRPSATSHVSHSR